MPRYYKASGNTNYSQPYLNSRNCSIVIWDFLSLILESFLPNMHKYSDKESMESLQMSRILCITPLSSVFCSEIYDFLDIPRTSWTQQDLWVLLGFPALSCTAFQKFQAAIWGNCRAHLPFSFSVLFYLFSNARKLVSHILSSFLFFYGQRAIPISYNPTWTEAEAIHWVLFLKLKCSWFFFTSIEFLISVTRVFNYGISIW